MIDKFFLWLDKMIDVFVKDEKLNEKIKKLLNKETVLYLVFGVLTTAVNFIVYFPLYFLFKQPLGEAVAVNTATPLAWFFAVLFAFITNKFFVFESKTTEKKLLLKEITAFFGGRLFSLLFEQVWNNVTILRLGMNAIIAKLIAQIVIIVMNYFISKLLVFTNKKES